MLFFGFCRIIKKAVPAIKIRAGPGKEKKMFDMVAIGKRLAEMRKRRDMTQFELADKLGISSQAVSNWERGNSMPDISKLPEIAGIFEVSVDELLGADAGTVRAAFSPNGTGLSESTEEELADLASIAKPSVMVDLIEKMPNCPRLVTAFLPYLSESTVESLAVSSFERGESVAVYLPYLRKEVVERFLEETEKKGEPISLYLPFLEESAVKKYALRAIERKEPLERMHGYFQFMNERDIGEVIKKWTETDDAGA